MKNTTLDIKIHLLYTLYTYSNDKQQSPLKIRENIWKLFNRYSPPRIQSEPQNDQMCEVEAAGGGGGGSLGRVYHCIKPNQNQFISLKATVKQINSKLSG